MDRRLPAAAGREGGKHDARGNDPCAPDERKMTPASHATHATPLLTAPPDECSYQTRFGATFIVTLKNGR
jgi:hypothetical protein